MNGHSNISAFVTAEQIGRIKSVAKSTGKEWAKSRRFPIHRSQPDGTLWFGVDNETWSSGELSRHSLFLTPEEISKAKDLAEKAKNNPDFAPVRRITPYAYLNAKQISRIRGLALRNARRWAATRGFPILIGDLGQKIYGIPEEYFEDGGHLSSYHLVLDEADVLEAHRLAGTKFSSPNLIVEDRLYFMTYKQFAKVLGKTYTTAHQIAACNNAPRYPHPDGKFRVGISGEMMLEFNGALSRLDDEEIRAVSEYKPVGEASYAPIPTNENPEFWNIETRRKNHAHRETNYADRMERLKQAPGGSGYVSSDYTRQLMLYDVGQSDEGDSKTVEKPEAAIKKIDEPKTLNEIDLDPEDHFGDPSIFSDFDDDDFGKIDDDDFDPKNYSGLEEEDDGFGVDDDDFDPGVFGDPLGDDDPVERPDLEFENDVDKPVAFVSVPEYAKGMGIKNLVAAEHNLIMSGCHRMVCDDGVVRYGLTDRMYFSDDFNWHDIDLDEFTECEDWANDFRERRIVALADEDKDGLFTGFLLCVNMILGLIGSFIRGAFTNPVLEWQQAELARLRDENAELKELVARMTADNDDHAAERKAA
jgi:hypothetical protein